MRPVHRSTTVRIVAALTAATVAFTVQPAAAARPDEPAQDRSIRSRAAADAPAAAPGFAVRTLVGGLDHPWDVAFTPNGSLLITQRDRGTIVIRRPNGAVRTLVSSVPGLWVSGETGLMSVVVDPRFGSNRRFYLCHGFINSGGDHDVRVTVWRANPSLTSATQVKVLLRGILSTSGRHGGCRLRFGGNGALYIGTGDAAVTGSARNRGSFAGKVLRVGRFTGHALPGNPFIGSGHSRTRKIWTYGHRNVQGLTQRPDGPMWSVEHGTFRDDEVNRLRPGGDYGWQAGPGYDESPPMTDFSLPGRQIGARWSSGNPTVAASGATWLSHRLWGPRRGTLAVAALKDRSVRIMRFDGDGRLVSVARPPALTNFGRLRTAQLGPNGRLLLTTDNGGGADRVLVVAPDR
jgi:glucose/arabinose dehydrogenase